MTGIQKFKPHDVDDDVESPIYGDAPIEVPLDFTFSLLVPNTQAVKDAIAAELRDLLERDGSPGGTILLSHIREAISIAAGEDNYTLTAPAADVAHATGQLPTLGVITWP